MKVIDTQTHWYSRTLLEAYVSSSTYPPCERDGEVGEGSSGDDGGRALRGRIEHGGAKLDGAETRLGAGGLVDEGAPGGADQEGLAQGGDVHGERTGGARRRVGERRRSRRIGQKADVDSSSGDGALGDEAGEVCVREIAVARDVVAGDEGEKRRQEEAGAAHSA